jgi:hypothetical protein
MRWDHRRSRRREGKGLLRRSNTMSHWIMSTLLVIATVLLAPACYTLGYLTASIRIPDSTDYYNDKFETEQSSAMRISTEHSNISYILQKPCGRTVGEAKNRGCHYDMVEIAWVPTQCYDAELEQQLKASGNWTFFLFANQSSAITSSLKTTKMERGTMQTVAGHIQ